VLQAVPSVFNGFYLQGGGRRSSPRGAYDVVILRMSEREYEQLFFAISKAHDMASALEKLYHAD
jgi:hypothetical protein